MVVRATAPTTEAHMVATGINGITKPSISIKPIQKAGVRSKADLNSVAPGVDGVTTAVSVETVGGEAGEVAGTIRSGNGC
jgi:hypothetical protein